MPRERKTADRPLEKVNRPTVMKMRTNPTTSKSGRLKRRERERAQCIECVQKLRENPDSRGFAELAELLKLRSPDLWDEAVASEAAKDEVKL